MIKVAICDDDLTMTSYIEEILLQIGKEQNIKIACDIFFDGTTLMESIQQNICYDLIYLDIEMKKMNGISTALMIRDMDFPVLIIYISSYEKYLKELFDTEPFRFLSKPLKEDDFYSAFWAAYKKISQRAEYFSYTYNRSLIKIPINRITYFESSNRIIYIHADRNMNSYIKGDENLKFYGKMTDVEEQLSEGHSRFLRIHQSFLVNFDYIKSLTFINVTMADGTLLQISEDRQKKVRNQFCTMTGLEVRK